MTVHVEYVFNSIRLGWISRSHDYDRMEFIHEYRDTSYWYTSINGTDVSNMTTEEVLLFFKLLD